VLEACTADGLFELPPISGTSYVAFCDPSGGSSDSMTLAIAHHDDGVAALDCVREVRAPFSPESAVEDFCKELASYGVAKVTGDRYAGLWPTEQFAKRNVTYVPGSCMYREKRCRAATGAPQALVERSMLARTSPGSPSICAGFHGSSEGMLPRADAGSTPANPRSDTIANAVTASPKDIPNVSRNT
jgi:hypothetical protein